MIGEALEAPHGAVISSCPRLIPLKYLHRVYYTRSCLWHMGLIGFSTCLRCEAEEDTLIHTVWSCTALTCFWREVLSCLGEVLTWDVPFVPKLLLLHSTEGIGGNCYKRHLLFLGLTLARRDIARYWKASVPLSLGSWKRGKGYCLGLETKQYSRLGDAPRNI